MNKKLQEIGNKLKISKHDIQKIKRGSIKNKLLVIVIGVVIAIIAFILGFLLKKKTCPCLPPGRLPPGYPFAPSPIIGAFLFQKKQNSRMVGLLISAVTFLSSIAYPVFGQEILYNIIKRTL